jgi:hypothetical protein
MRRYASRQGAPSGARQRQASRPDYPSDVSVEGAAPARPAPSAGPASV